MTMDECARKAGWQLVVGKDTADSTVSGCYVGDLLSWVMGRAKSGEIWITVMGNVNAVAVAVLTDVAAIVLAQGAKLDEEAYRKAEIQGVAVYCCDKPAYEIATEVYEILR